MDDIGQRPPVSLWLRESDGAWYGIAESGHELVATSVGAAKDEASRVLAACLPPGVEGAAAGGEPGRGPEGMGPSAFADEVARMLAAIEAGDESGKVFPISKAWVPEPAASVYRLAAAIPLGYATSYGRIAAAAGTIAREVGRLMANNQLYPLVPCHRVVGSDYSLVGYRGAKEGPELEVKLSRLRAEARGYVEDLLLDGAGGLMVFPVERVIERAERRRAEDKGQLALF